MVDQTMPGIMLPPGQGDKVLWTSGSFPATGAAVMFGLLVW